MPASKDMVLHLQPMTKKVRVRFAPSPTGGLHLGGVRTVLFNYLFAKKQGGDFVLRIEDTDQTRFVEGAEEYIYECLQWCGMEPDESPKKGGPFAPYRQSERKAHYKQYADQLIAQGHAYYAFDSSEELETMRTQFKTESNPSPMYDGKLRMQMKNSLSLPADETKALLDSGAKYVVRIKMPENETISFTDLIRGEVSFNTSLSDDKVLLKADGMPTYHLAVVVDDYTMKITHAFRGEEWLPSAPIHLLLWKYLGWQTDMPEWAHLPLILKPDGNGKLSKRDGDRLGFPVFAMNWTDPKTNELMTGFRERGFLPEAFVNMLAMLGWNPGTEQELFSMDELIEKFDISRVHKGGAKFDFEKAKWFNHEWIKKLSDAELANKVQPILTTHAVVAEGSKLEKVCALVKDRITFIEDFWAQAAFFFVAPTAHDVAAIQPKWNAEKTNFFKDFVQQNANISNWDALSIEAAFKELATAKNIKVGELQLPLRIMLVGAKFGPGVFDIAALIGKDEMNARIEQVLGLLNT
jgi:glutamyl-tRNA synthetase